MRFVDIDCSAVTEVIGRRAFKSRADIQEFLDNIPTADVAPVIHAKWQFWEGWMSNHDMRIDDATCSNCGYKHPIVRRIYGIKETEQEVLNKLSNYCAACGAKMDLK